MSQVEYTNKVCSPIEDSLEMNRSKIDLIKVKLESLRIRLAPVLKAGAYPDNNDVPSTPENDSPIGLALKLHNVHLGELMEIIDEISDRLEV